MRGVIGVACVAFVVVVIAGGMDAASAASTPPNVVLFIVDDVGWANVGWHNNNTYTPNANAMLSESVELDRNYVFWYCSPTRSSLMTGRLPLHVTEDNGNACTLEGAAPRNMTMLPEKLKSANPPYHTVHVGKWHLGTASNKSIPAGRGFDSSFGYLQGAEDHYTNENGGCGGCGSHVDLYHDFQPAVGQNGSGYSAYMWNDHTINAIESHAKDFTDQPLFMYVATQTAHAPNQADVFGDRFAKDYTKDFADYNGMCSAWDSMLGNVTASLKKNGMWDNTLLVFSSDNGGPSSAFVSGENANNYPLRGGKHTAWDGGHRAAAFVSGGLIPQAMHGKKLEGYVHIADWYGTIARLAGVDPSDDQPGMPAVDSVDLWPYLTGANATSPRNEVPLSSKYAASGTPGSAALIMGDYKLVRNYQQYCFWTGPVYPNASTNHKDDAHCPSVCPETGCLFNIMEDPGEHVDLAASNPSMHAKLLQRAQELDKTAIKAIKPAGWRGAIDKQAMCTQMEKNHGFWGPYLNN